MNLIWKSLKVNAYGDNYFIEVFYNTLIFSLLLVTLFSIIATAGKTIFIFNLPILFLLYYYTKKNGNLIVQNPEIKIKRHIAILSIVAISVFVLLSSFYFVLTFSMRNDVAHYTKISECLFTQGIENPYHYYNNDNQIFKGNSPYHYFEMWFGGIFFKLNSILGISMFSNYMFYIYFVFNLFRAIVLIGVFGIVSRFVKFNWIYFLIIFPFFIIDISAFCTWGIDSYVAQSNFIKRPNFIFYYLFLIPIFNSILDKNKISLALWSAIFILATITALPAVFASLLFYLIYFWVKNQQNRNEILKIVISFFIFFILIAIFYKFFGVAKEAVTLESMSIKQMIAKSLSIWKACIFMFAMLSFKIGIFIALIFLIIWNKLSFNFKFAKSFNFLLFYVCLLCFTGIGIFQLVPYLDNMYQFAFLGYCAVILLLTIVLIIKIANLTLLKKCILTSTLFVLLFWAFNRNLLYDQMIFNSINWKVDLKSNFLLQHGLPIDYINELENNAVQLSKLNGASIIDEKDAVNDFLGLRHSVTYQLGNYLMAFNNYVYLPLLSNPHTLYSDIDTLSKDYYKAKNFNRKTSFFRNYNDSISYFQKFTQIHDKK